MKSTVEPNCTQRETTGEERIFDVGLVVCARQVIPDESRNNPMQPKCLFWQSVNCRCYRYFSPSDTVVVRHFEHEQTQALRLTTNFTYTRKIQTRRHGHLCRPLTQIQDLEEPADEWVEQKTRSGKLFYTNPATGKRGTNRQRGLLSGLGSCVILYAVHCYPSILYLVMILVQKTLWRAYYVGRRFPTRLYAS